MNVMTKDLLTVILIGGTLSLCAVIAPVWVTWLYIGILLGILVVKDRK